MLMHFPSKIESVRMRAHARVLTQMLIDIDKQATGAPLHQHGVQFDNIAPRIVLLVYELPQEIR
jgi:hypothetical protein